MCQVMLSICQIEGGHPHGVYFTQVDSPVLQFSLGFDCLVYMYM